MRQRKKKEKRGVKLQPVFRGGKMVGFRPVTGPRRPPKPLEQMTYKELQAEVRKWEGRRLTLPRRANVKTALIQDTYTQTIKKLYELMEKKRQEEGKKATTKTVVEKVKK